MPIACAERVGLSRRLTAVKVIHLASSLDDSADRLRGSGTGSSDAAISGFRFASASSARFSSLALACCSKTSACVGSDLASEPEMLASEFAGILRTVVVSNDGAISRNELNDDLGLAACVTRQHEMQIADLVGPQIPFCVIIGSSRGQLAALWQSPYRNDATGWHPISTIEGNWEGHILARGRIQCRRG